MPQNCEVSKKSKTFYGIKATLIVTLRYVTITTSPLTYG